MNKIVDRPSDTNSVTQPQSRPTDGKLGDNKALNNDSIVTYRTDQGVDTANANADQVGQKSAEQSSSASKQPLKDTLSVPQARGSIWMLLGIIGLSVAGGYLLGQQRLAGQNQPITSNASLFSNAIGNEAVVEPTMPVQVSDAQAQALLVQTEITDQLGDMRAELLRLHAVFVRLTEVAELDDGEFDLQSPLLDWKDQSSLYKMDLLNRRIAHMSASSGTLGAIFDLRRMAYDQKISGRPIVEGSRTSGFGYRTDPISGERLEHLGLDYSGPVGEPILALADGIVTFSGKNSGYGNLVELEHVGGLRTRYAHNQANLVKSGARVFKGQAIATLGSTGRSTGPHVHVEVRLDGTPIDPGFFVR